MNGTTYYLIFLRYHETGVVLAVKMCRILVPGTWDHDGPKNDTTPVVKYLVKYLVP